MGIEMEGLEFQIETKAEESVKGIDALTESLGSLKKALKGGLGLGSSVKQLERLTTAVNGLKSDKIVSLGTALKDMNDVNIPSTVAKRISSIGAALKDITLSDVERVEDLGKALRDLQEIGNVKIPKVSVPKNIVPDTITTGTDAGVTPATSGMEQAVSQTQEVSQTVGQATERVNMLKRVLNGIGGVFSKGFSTGVGVLQRLTKGLRSAGSAAKSLMQKTIGIPKNLGAKFASAMKQHTAGLGQFMSSLKRIAMYRLARFALAQLTKAFKEGINNLYQYSNIMGGQFATSMNSLATNAQYLKNSLGAMSAPIINALAPAIDFVIGKIATLLNYINMLVARLSGASTFTAAKKSATSYGEALSGAGGAAADAAKEIKNATTGIDELNMIMENDSSSGGGGGGGADYGSMFEELPIDSNVSDFADRLKEAFDNADWKTLGTLLGEKVNEMVNMVDWFGLGEKLGYGLNGAIQTLYWFLDTVDFTNIGTKLAEFINGAVGQIDWEYVGRLITKGVTILPDFIIGGITGLDWGLLARSFSDLVIGMFDEATKWFNKYDWSELGSFVWQSIKDVISNIDWSGVARSLFTALGTAIRSCVQFLGGFFGGIGTDIKTWWDTEIKGQNWKETGSNLLKWIGEGLVDIGSWVVTNMVDPFCNALLGEDVWADIKQVGKDLWDGLCSGITEFFADPGEWIKTNIVDPFVTWFKDLFGIHSPSTVMAEIGGDIIQGLLNGILAPFKAIGEWVNTNIVQPLVTAFGDSPLAEFFVGVKNTASDWWDDVCSWWDGVSENGVSLSAAVSLVKQGWTTVKKWIGNIPVVSQAVSLIKSGWSTVKSWIGNLPTLNQTIALVKQGWTTVKNWIGRLPVISQAISLIKSGWTTVKNWVGNIPTLNQAISLIKQGWTTVKGWIGNIPTLSQSISLIKSGWTTVKNWVGNIPTLNQAISLIKQGWTTVKNWVGNIPVLSQGISLIKSGWVTVKGWIGNIPVLNQGISLIKSGWTTVKGWIGNIPTLSQAISLAKSGWTTVKNWIGNLPVISQLISLAKSGWTSVKNWINCSTVSVGISLFKSGWSSLSSWIGTSVSVGISLFKSGWSSIKSFFGLANGGIVGANGGVKAFKSGGAINGNLTEMWGNVPKYAGGTLNAHGSMFVAGEAGAELVGHVNGRTEVLNKSQLGQIMHRSIVDGMAQFAGYWNAINAHLTTCTNATISAMLMTANTLYQGMNTREAYAVAGVNDWVDAVGNRVSMEFSGAATADQIKDGVREGVYEATARQNELLREQNDLLMRLVNKETIVQIGNKTIKDAVVTQEKADGFKFTK